MKLAAYKGQSNLFSIVRDLTDEEARRSDEYKPVVADARERLKLFRILDHNFTEWTRYVNSLLSAEPGDRDDEMLHLDRLLLNYLTCVYTLRKHFEVLITHRFGKDSKEQKAYFDYVDKLCATFWAVGFFFDFRGYVQHRGLGIGYYNRQFDDVSVKLMISCDAKILATESRDWKHSKLSGNEGMLNLVPLLREFHVQMIQSYGAFIAKTLFPLLAAASDFYRELTKEVRQKIPGARMVFASRDIEVAKAKEKTSYKFDMIQVPNDLFPELGISPNIDERGWRSFDFSRL